MHEAIRRARETDYTLIALLGHPAYYPRFGFAPAAETLGVTTVYEAPPEAWMALALPAYEPQRPAASSATPPPSPAGEEPHPYSETGVARPLVERVPRPLRSPGGETSDAGEYGYET